MLTIFTAPAIMFFMLGVSSSIVNTDIKISETLVKAMSIFLLIAIGLKGGINLLDFGITPEVIYTIISGIIISFIIPILSFLYLTLISKLDTINAAAISAHYGSISIITFVTATVLLESLGIPYEGFMVAVAAAMEAPAIITAIYLAGKSSNLKEVFLNDSIVFLLGAFAIGIISGPIGTQAITPFFTELFQGVLCLFLLAMGLKIGPKLKNIKQHINLKLISFAILAPIVFSIIGLVVAGIIGLSAGSTILFMTLCASASYIAAPAAMQIALPEANSSLYFLMSLGITFTFNVLFGIPLYIEIFNLIN